MPARSPVGVRCPQCARVVPLVEFDPRHNRCHSCRSASLALYRYWRLRGMRVSEHKHPRSWLNRMAD